MHGQFLKWHISHLVAPIEALFVASLLAFGKLCDDITFFCREVILPEVIKEIAYANSTHPYYKYSTLMDRVRY